MKKRKIKIYINLFPYKRTVNRPLYWHEKPILIKPTFF